MFERLSVFVNRVLGPNMEEALGPNREEGTQN